MGRDAAVIATRETSEYTKEARFAATAAERCGIKIFNSARMSDGEITGALETSGVIVDALLGVGTRGEPRGEVKRLIELSARRPRAVSLDIPSGVDADTGEAGEVSFRAELTVAFLALKPGHAISPGALLCGETIIAGIGIKPEQALDAPPSLRGYDRTDMEAMTPRLPRDIHKGSRGSLLIVGGSSNYRGAPVLSALAALKAGCGLVALAAPESVIPSAAAVLPEAVFIPLPEREGHIRFDGLEEILFPFADKYDALALGPGIGLSGDARKTAALLHDKWPRPILADADALGAINGVRRPDVVATPHAGEASRVLGVSPADVERRRLRSCRELTARFGVALLKGARALISDGAETRVILEGGPELAVPGSGDVLSGAVGAFLAAGLKPIDAATLGALAHGAAGSRLASLGGTNGTLAREIAGAMREFVLFKEA
jgi:NAD(P)H-hydrate epimerase